MSLMKFHPSLTHTLGVEIELALVDARTMALTPAAPALLARVPAGYGESIKPELMQSYVEINSRVCDTVADAEHDLRDKLAVVERLADETGVRLLWSATHPFSSWREQKVTDIPRYHGLIDLLQDTARQLVTFGLHVHVGVDSGDKAVMICDRMLRHLPVLLAASCNSPFWNGRVTGLHSWRSRVMEALPTAGLPPLMRNWSEYVWLIHHLVETGYIQTIREIWWDMRPHNNFGTVEMRICDVPGSLDDCLALAALVQCLVKTLSDQIDRGTYQHDSHPMMARQNKWSAARYGLDAELVDAETYQRRPVRETLRDLVRLLRPAADDLDCRPYLERVLSIAAGPTWSQRQMEIWEQTHDMREVVRRLTDACRVVPNVA